MKTRFFFKIVITTLVNSIILFIFAGRIDYFQGWIFLGTNLVTSLMTFAATMNDSDLIKERSTIGDGAKSWDKMILGLSAISYIAFLAVSGLDSGRFGWSRQFPVFIFISGIILTIAGQFIFLTAKRENRFFSTVVRIQTERGHKVCDTGVYRIVRHPGYCGMLLSLAALPMLTGSVWSIIPAGIGIILLIIRTWLEDETLKKELAGYAEYSLLTKHRLVPGIW
ncbi:MAG TPA: isoprenylcysteine carboxylmethyltransferase family protein [Bacteroidales bacterium]|nr:isoprenylcysteine carboxylmethyltransferase family protein [Bacteroidales bacterium]